MLPLPKTHYQQLTAELMHFKDYFFFPSDCMIWCYPPLTCLTDYWAFKGGTNVTLEIFQCLKGKICKPNFLMVGVTDLELTSYNSARQCRTVSAQNEHNPTRLMAAASCHTAVTEEDRLSRKVPDWPCLFIWTQFAFSGFFWLFLVKCLSKYVNN